MRRFFRFVRRAFRGGAAHRPAAGSWTKPVGATTVQVTCAGGGMGGGYAHRPDQS